jgi:hypothetical protein
MCHPAEHIKGTSPEVHGVALHSRGPACEYDTSSSESDEVNRVKVFDGGTT